MLNVSLQNWEDYKEELGVKSLAALARLLDVPPRTLQGWMAGDRKPAEYVESMINRRLNEIIRDNYIEKAENAALQIKSKIKEGDLLQLRTKLVRAMSDGNKRECCNAILQLSVLTDVYTEFMDILLIDWNPEEKDYKAMGFYYPVLLTFAMKLM